MTMNLLIIAAIAAVATAAPSKTGLVTPVAAGPAPVIIGPEIIENNPVGPALVDPFEPIAIGPAIIDNILPAIVPHPISVGPEIIDFPLPETVVTTASAPLVQIILNIKQSGLTGGASPVEIIPTPVQVVESAPVLPGSPVQVVDTAPVPEPVIIGNPTLPLPVEPVIIGNPIIPVPAINLPEELN